jgi:hypothetical protein
MSNTVQDIFAKFYPLYLQLYDLNNAYDKVARAILNCKTGVLGSNASVCGDCGHVEIHHNSCRNRNCPNCQAIPRALWIDARKSEVIDAPYYHVVFTVPSELNSLIFSNQKALYSLFHKCVSQTLLELTADDKFLGAKPGIIQVLHTWGQRLDYHPHIHCIISGGGLTTANTFKEVGDAFFIPVHVLSKKFRGKFLFLLEKEYNSGKLSFPSSIGHLSVPRNWDIFIRSLRYKEWIPFIKETFNGQGNAIDYLGRYTHRIAISNSRILKITDTHVTFKAKDYQTNQDIEVTLTGVEFIRRFFMHVLPKGFVKIRNCGFLANSIKLKSLKIIRIHTRNLNNKAELIGLKTAALLLRLFGVDIHVCPKCNSKNYHQSTPYRMVC